MGVRLIRIPATLSTAVEIQCGESPKQKNCRNSKTYFFARKPASILLAFSICPKSLGRRVTVSRFLCRNWTLFLGPIYRGSLQDTSWRLLTFYLQTILETRAIPTLPNANSFRAISLDMLVIASS
eukprot:GHVT01055736.1.p1 GENE.GHVT01055736.1~~GHVT01055736.1.p1  ORF type:complete len:125 (-),score=1.01 GHVT01055736.1:931-1305(-)